MKKTGFFQSAFLFFRAGAAFWALAALSPAVFPLKLQYLMPSPPLHLIVFVGAGLFGSAALSLCLIFFGGLVLSALSSASAIFTAGFLAGLYGLLLVAKIFFHWKKREVWTAAIFAAGFLFFFLLNLFHSPAAAGGGAASFGFFDFFLPCLLSAALTAALAFPLFPLIRKQLERSPS